MPTPALYAICVLIWGTTWFAITAQIDVLAPAVGVALRFGLAALALMLACRVRGIALRQPRRVHLLLLAQGLAGFCASYICVYEAERRVVSGVVAVGFAASPLFGLILARGFLGTRMSGRVALGGVIGIVGVLLIFAHEFARISASHQVVVGAELTMASVLLSSLATIAASRAHRLGASGWSPLAWAMGYGAAGAALFALAEGVPWGWSWRPQFVGSLLYLAVFGSIIAFGAYFALLHRLGAAQVGYVGVLTPVVALVVSSAFEHFVWTGLTVAGVALALAGNLVSMWPGARRRAV